MKAQDVRHLRLCTSCGRLGDGRKMLTIQLPGLFHDHCVVQLLSHDEILKLPEAEREKFTIGAVGPELMRKLIDAYAAPGQAESSISTGHVLGSDCATRPGFPGSLNPSTPPT